jgi:hypothetical protein
LFPEAVWTTPAASFQLLAHLRDQASRLAVSGGSSHFCLGFQGRKGLAIPTNRTNWPGHYTEF